MKKRKETRIEIIEGGLRKFVKWNCKIEESIQDNNRTLKLFISDRKEKLEITEDKIQRGDSVTSEDLNRLWDSKLKEMDKNEKQ